MKRLLLPFIISIAFQSLLFAQGQSISNFGTNPGNLNAYKYVPANMPSNAPLVVVIHGCTQNAAGFANETQWNTLADFHKFYVVYAEQKSSNNSSSCFNYWEPGDHSRGQGEAESIKQMIDYMKSNYSVDASRVFATGLSAGGAMTAVMLSAYPEVFAAGAEMAGLPYKVATNSLEVYTAAVGLTSKSPQQWGDLVRAQNPNFTGAYPRMAIFHGTSDIVINENNGEEMMKQFTNLHGTDQTSDVTDASFNGNSVVELKQYKNANGQVVVERYTFDGMGHGIATDPGSCYDQGGGSSGTTYDVNFFSSFYAAKFFGILQPPFSISGPVLVTDSANGIGYSVSGSGGATYNWQVAGGTIAGGQGTNSISVDWADSTGLVSLTQTTSGGCTLGPVDLSVVIHIADTIEEPIDTIDEPIDTIDEPIDTIDEPIDTTTGIVKVVLMKEEFLITTNNGRLELSMKSPYVHDVKVSLYNAGGQLVFESLFPVNQSRSLPQFPPGIYIVKCVSWENQFVKKVLVH